MSLDELGSQYSAASSHETYNTGYPTTGEPVGAPTPPPQSKPKFVIKWWVWAIIAVIVLVIMYFVFF